MKTKTHPNLTYHSTDAGKLTPWKYRISLPMSGYRNDWRYDRRNWVGYWSSFVVKPEHVWCKHNLIYFFCFPVLITFNNKAAKEHCLDILASLGNVQTTTTTKQQNRNPNAPQTNKKTPNQPTKNKKQNKEQKKSPQDPPKPNKNHHKRTQNKTEEEDTDFYLQLVHSVLDICFPINVLGVCLFYCCEVVLVSLSSLMPEEYKLYCSSAQNELLHA